MRTIDADKLINFIKDSIKAHETFIDNIWEGHETISSNCDAYQFWIHASGRVSECHDILDEIEKMLEEEKEK